MGQGPCYFLLRAAVVRVAAATSWLVSTVFFRVIFSIPGSWIASYAVRLSPSLIMQTCPCAIISLVRSHEACFSTNKQLSVFA